mmetsp:Transcript_2376/g.9322  ORF Transcript_2376/g.9322 Transcript_2376/m.9322 type:complete len:221 (+) Transcript_2376:876-1538(+)
MEPWSSSMNASHDRHLSTSVSSRRAPRACASFSSRARSVLSDDSSISSSTRDCLPTRLFPSRAAAVPGGGFGAETVAPIARVALSPFRTNISWRTQNDSPARFRTSGAEHDDTGHTSFVSVQPMSIFSATRPDTSTTPSRRTKPSIPPSTPVASSRADGDLASSASPSSSSDVPTSRARAPSRSRASSSSSLSASHASTAPLRAPCSTSSSRTDASPPAQ